MMKYCVSGLSIMIQNITMSTEVAGTVTSALSTADQDVMLALNIVTMESVTMTPPSVFVKEVSAMMKNTPVRPHPSPLDQDSTAMDMNMTMTQRS